MNTEGKVSLLNSNFLRCFLLFIFLISCGSTLVAQGSLLIFPKRLVLDGKKKAERLVLSNTGKDTAVYSISFIEYKMNENGEMLEIDKEEPGLNFSSPYVRIYPRVVTLGPNESQILKVQAYNTQALADGEYRSHLYFRAEKENTALGTAKKEKETMLSIKLEAIFGISIACILRKGMDSTTVSVSDMKYLNTNEKEDFLEFKVNRTGNMSAYGDFSISYTAVNKRIYEVGNGKGIGVYAPGNFRNMKIKLNKPDNVNFIGGSFKVIFTENESKKVLTEAELKL